VLVEIIPDDPGRPKRGEVIVTDLNNRLMPLLRYRLGDLAVLREGKCPCGRGLPLLEGFAGRSQDQYLIVAGGRRVHAACFDYLYDHLMESGIVIKQVQVEQSSAK
jgi:phenylacetate-CoA ligase